MKTTTTTRAKSLTPTQLKSEIAQLQKQVADLSKQLATLKSRKEPEAFLSIGQDRPWMRIAATVAATFVLGRIVDRFRLGAAGATAVPMIAAQLGHRFSLTHRRR
jgi:hypothetical protein